MFFPILDLVVGAWATIPRVTLVVAPTMIRRGKPGCPGALAQPDNVFHTLNSLFR